MREFIESIALLSEMVNRDPFMELANAVTWLDPLWHQRDDEVHEGDELEQSFHILRDTMPEIYVDALGKLYDKVGEVDLCNFICGRITQLGIPIDYIEEMVHGIPMYPVGLDLHNAETYEAHPELLPLFDAFGIDLEGDHADMPEGLRRVACALAENLDDQPDPAWKKVTHLIDWAFSCSGNTLIDYDQEGLEGMEQAMWWEESTVALAIDMYDEVDTWMKDSQDSLKWLAEHPDMMEALTANIKTVFSKVESLTGKKEIDGHGLNLAWPNSHTGIGGAALVSAEHLQLRSDTA